MGFFRRIYERDSKNSATVALWRLRELTVTRGLELSEKEVNAISTKLGTMLTQTQILDLSESRLVRLIEAQSGKVANFIESSNSASKLLSAIDIRVMGTYGYGKASRLRQRNASKARRAAAPRFPKFVLLLVPLKNREHLLGDLDEEYCTVVLPEYGPRIAKLWCWWQVASSIAPLLWAQVKRILGLVILWRISQ